VASNRGLAYIGQGNLEAAITAYRQALPLAPDSLLAHWNLAQALEAGGDLSGAQGEYETILTLDPTFLEAAQRLAALLSRLGRPASARLGLAQADQYRL